LKAQLKTQFENSENTVAKLSKDLNNVISIIRKFDDRNVEISTKLDTYGLLTQQELKRLETNQNTKPRPSTPEPNDVMMKNVLNLIKKVSHDQNAKYEKLENRMNTFSTSDLNLKLNKNMDLSLV
jgi:hypothetical protein